MTLLVKGKINLDGKIKKETGKGVNRRLRAQGLMPAVFYSKKENIPLTIVARDMDKIKEKYGLSVLIDLAVEGDSQQTRKVILKDMQTHPIKSGFVHIDFQEVDMSVKIKVPVPVVLVGHSPGEKMGGIVNHILKTVQILCLPGNIPAEIEVDMSEVALDQVIHISDIKVSEGIEFLHKPNESVVTVHEEKVKEVVAAEGEEGAEGEAAEGAKPEGEKEGNKAAKAEKE